MTETAMMAKKKPKPAADKGSEQYRKAHKMVRIRIRLAEAGEKAAEALHQDLTQFINDAVRERLERLGLLTPLQPPPCSLPPATGAERPPLPPGG